MAPATASTRESAGVLTALERVHVPGVKSLLRNLPSDYPGGEDWLRGRLSDAIDGDAECWLSMRYGQIAGVAILTPKPSALKLSTIFVAERFRGLGFGSALLDRTLRVAAALDREETYVTVAEHKVPLLMPLLDSRGFTYAALERHRYGRDRHEAIFTRLQS